MRPNTYPSSQGVSCQIDRTEFTIADGSPTEIRWRRAGTRLRRWHPRLGARACATSQRELHGKHWCAKGQRNVVSARLALAGRSSGMSMMQQPRRRRLFLLVTSGGQHRQFRLRGGPRAVNGQMNDPRRRGNHPLTHFSDCGRPRLKTDKQILATCVRLSSRSR